MSDQSNSGGLFLGGLLLGAAAGAITGLLLAPKSGRETRALLKQSAEALPELAEDLSATVQIQAERLSDSALRSWDNTLLRLREAIEAGIEASRQAEAVAQPPIAMASPLPVAPANEAKPNAKPNAKTVPPA